MKYLLFVSLVLATATLALADQHGLKTQTAMGRIVTVTDAQNGKTIKLTKSNILVVRLAANVTTGYSWKVGKTPGCVKLDGKTQYEAPKKQLAGAGGTFVAKFKVTKAGKGKLTFAYARPWEKKTPPVKTFAIDVVIAKPKG